MDIYQPLMVTNMLLARCVWLPAPPIITHMHARHQCVFSLRGRGQCGTDAAREGALQLVKAMEALNPTQEPAKQQGEALIQGADTTDATRCPEDS